MWQETVYLGRSILPNKIRKFSRLLPTSQVKQLLGCTKILEADDWFILGISPLNTIASKTLSFSNLPLQKDDFDNKLVIAPHDSEASLNIVCVENPRLSFSKILKWIEKNIGFELLFKEEIHKSVLIGDNVNIGLGVKIGSGCVIENGVTISNNVSIGSDCYIKAHAVIGGEGFGFERDSFNVPQRIPHIGGVIIKNNVEIGSFVSINRGTIANTLVGDNVKVDDHVHIAHNCNVGANTLITAGVVLGGSVVVGKNCWLGLGAILHQKIQIADGVIVGMGSNVFHDLDDGLKVAGYPAKRIPS